MNELGVVLSAEFLRRVRSRAFIVATVIGAAGVVLMSLLPRLLAGSMGGNPNRIVLVGESALVAAAAPLLAHDFEIGAGRARVDGIPDNAYLKHHGDAAAVVVLSRSAGTLRATVYAKDPALFQSAFRRDLAPLQLAVATRTPLGALRHLEVAVTVHDVQGRFSDAGSAASAKGVAFVLVFLLYLGIMLNAQLIMSSVAEEKTNRIAELLLATIDPARLLAAKVLASTAGGLIQVAVWAAAGLAAGQAAGELYADASLPASHGAVFALAAPALPPGEVLAFVAFFVVGFLQYAVLYAAAASLVNRTEDLGSVAGPLVIPVVIGFLLAQMAVANPGTTGVLVCSQLPLLAPFVMFTRIAVSGVPAWQIGLSLAINVLAAVALAWFAGRVYRVGLLLYGRPPSLRQAIRAVTAR